MSTLRQDIEFPSGEDRIVGWLYRAKNATAAQPSPVIVLGHGLGAVKEMGLDRYSECFQTAGYSAIAFDYRGFGASGGVPRQVIDFDAQLEDWKAALDYVEALDFIDPQRIGFFGTTFGAGLAISFAAKDGRVKAAISQCPFTSGIHSALTVGFLPTLSLLWLALQDLIYARGNVPVKAPLAGKVGETAFMNAPDVWSGYRALLPEDLQGTATDLNYTAARFALQIPFLYPVAQAKNVECPIYFAVCGRDTVAPPGPTLSYAKRAPKGIVKLYKEAGHFDVYLGDWFDTVTSDYVEFLRTALPTQ